MENDKQNKAPQNGAANPATGSTVQKGAAQHEQTEVKEGNASQARPKYGTNGGPNTSTREDQLPSLTDGGAPEGSDAEHETEDFDDLEEQQKGSDADEDKDGETSL